MAANLFLCHIPAYRVKILLFFQEVPGMAGLETKQAVSGLTVKTEIQIWILKEETETEILLLPAHNFF
jgi:hypothetical protein